jgi:hypothetical protein
VPSLHDGWWLLTVSAALIPLVLSLFIAHPLRHAEAKVFQLWLIARRLHRIFQDSHHHLSSVLLAYPKDVVGQATTAKWRVRSAWASC